MKKFKYIYGPVSSWRLGSSLGVDLLSGNEKVCSLDCLYCQIGDTPLKTRKRELYIPTDDVMEEIKSLQPGLHIDYITFSGMGEPTLVKNLGEIIKAIKGLRKEKIAVITNASLIWDGSVRRDLALSDFVMAKLDSSDERSFKRINKPARGITFAGIYDGIKSFRKEYKERLGIQVMFFEMNKNEFKKLAELAFGADPDEIEINTPLRPCAVKPLSRGEIAGIRQYFEDFSRKTGSKAKIISVYDAENKKVEAINKEDTLRRREKKSS